MMPVPKTITSFREDARMLSSVVKLRLARDHTSRVLSIYSMYPPGHLISEESTYFNQGYWETGQESYDTAQQELARQLAEAAEIQSGDLVLDCGFGYGDQDFFFLREFDPKKIVGINITPEHLAYARARASREGVDDRIEFRKASATNIPFPDGTFDRVLALESAMHFDTRRTFFDEAFRVLRPGGQLATADIVPMPGAGPRDAALRSHAMSWLRSTIVESNWYDRNAYERELRVAGFTGVDVRSIQPKVWEPWRLYITERFSDPSFKTTVSPLYHWILRKVWANPEQVKRELETVDYVITKAVKPR